MNYLYATLAAFSLIVTGFQAPPPGALESRPADLSEWNAVQETKRMTACKTHGAIRNIRTEWHPVEFKCYGYFTEGQFVLDYDEQYSN